VEKKTKNKDAQVIHVVFYDFLKYVYKAKPEWAEQFKALVPDFDSRYTYLHSVSNMLTRGKATVTDYFKAMKIQYQEDFSVDGYKIDLYIPDKKIIIKVLTQSDINFDRFSLNGKGLITRKKFMKALQDIKQFSSIAMNSIISMIT